MLMRKGNLRAIALILGLAASAAAQTTQEKIESVAGALPAVPAADADFLPAAGQCQAIKFEALLEGWTRDRDSAWGEACSVEPIKPQPTCLAEPCFHIACRAVIHFHGVVELSPGQTRLWPSCFFSQQRMGTRSHNDEGQRRLDKPDLAPAPDFAGSVETGSVKFSKKLVPGHPNAYEFDFYDLPGWAEKYWQGTPNATAPKWFPLDWHYMYRTYFGPKRQGIADGDYTYVRVDMEGRVPPDQAFAANTQKVQTSADWLAFQQQLSLLPKPSEP